MLHVSNLIQMSMVASRRLLPVAPDVEFAFRANNVRFDSLLPQLKQLTAPEETLKPIPIQSSEITKPSAPVFLGSDLSGSAYRKRCSYVPKNFPDFPSMHTFRETPTFTTRERDPRKVREKATEEGRLGEQALRKLVGSVKADQAESASKALNKRRAKQNMSLNDMFEQTVKSLIQDPTANPSQDKTDSSSDTLGFDDLPNGNTTSRDPTISKFEMGPIVNSERIYWRKDAEARNRHLGRRTITSDGSLSGGR